mgnify:CR=1 FL=1
MTACAPPQPTAVAAAVALHAQADLRLHALAAPLLVAPLSGFTEVITPYVPLSHEVGAELPAAHQFDSVHTSHAVAPSDAW